MKYRIKRKLFQIFKNDTIAKLLTPLCFLPFLLVYQIKNLFVKNMAIDISDSRAKLEEIYPNKVEMPYGNGYDFEAEYDISVIIPCYNVENYINECVDSVLNQKGNLKIEVICVNDGSTDNTLKLLKEYGDKIKVIDKPNGGAAAARNTALDEAKGKYIFFLDSDDYITPECLEECYKTLVNKNMDVVSVGYCMLRNNNLLPCIGNGFCCGRLFKREIFNKYRFPINNVFEDSVRPFIINPIVKNECHINSLHYIYRANENGITGNIKKSVKGIGHLWVVECLAEINRENNLSNKEDLYKLVLSHFGSLFYERTKNFDKDMRQSIFLVACEILQKYYVKNVKKLSFAQIQIEKYLTNQNFAKWELACKWL